MFKKSKKEESTEQKEKTPQKNIMKPDMMKRILIGLFAVAAVVAGVLAYINTRDIIKSTDVFNLPGLSIAAPNTSSNTDDTAADGDTVSSPEINTENVVIDFSSRINVLLMGLDYRDWLEEDGPARTDTMILVTLDPVAKTAAILSIPRDLWVNVPGYGQNKINTAYFLGEANRLPGGGPALAARTVEEFLGIDVHYWAQVDFQAFVQFIDYIGGVKMDFPEDIRVERIGGDKEKIRAGTRTLDGSLALAYARIRTVGDGDFDRARRQQRLRGCL